MKKTTAITLYVLLAFALPTFAQDGDGDDSWMQDEGSAEDGMYENIVHPQPHITVRDPFDPAQVLHPPTNASVRHDVNPGTPTLFTLMTWNCAAQIQGTGYVQLLVSCMNGPVGFRVQVRCLEDPDPTTFLIRAGAHVKEVEVVCPVAPH